MTNTNKYGRGLENYTVAKLEEITSVKMGSKSGSAGNPTASDIFTNALQIECKRRNEDGKTTNTIIQKAWWLKVTKRARLNAKMPAIVTSENRVQEAMITMRLRDFIQLVDAEKI